MTSPAAKQAFNIHAEPDKLRDEYGRHTLGQSCLMARRLVEAGVRCVTIEHSNWDTHDGNFATLKNHAAAAARPGDGDAVPRPVRPRACWRRRWSSSPASSAARRGSTRTPAATTGARRSRCCSAAAACKGGRVIGASDERAERPADQPHGPEDLFATIFHLLGIDPNDEFLTPEGRPVKIVNNGRVIRGLL